MPDNIAKNLGAKCTPCVRFFKLIPVLFIAGTIAWSYYAYMVQLCYYAVENIFEKILYYIVSHMIFVMFIWSYWKTIVTPIGVAPPHFKLPTTDAESLMLETDEENQRRILENFAKDLPVNCRTMNGSIRYCEKCRHIKPDRAHHCSICGVCVLKMDHHCPWVNNCVSFTNYKFFILFLGYALLYCLFVATTTLKYFILFWTKNLEVGGKLHILFLFFVALMFGISLISLFVYHCYLVAVNKSTLESFRSPVFRTGPEKNAFHIGKRENFIQVFGDNPKKWFLPVHSCMGNGVEFPTHMQANSNYNSMGNTDQERLESVDVISKT